jgi:hypothetical protein
VLFAAFYAATGLATAIYYRALVRRPDLLYVTGRR